jgi:hypothetical protein
MEAEVIRGIGSETPEWMPPNPVAPPSATPLPNTPLPARATVSDGLAVNGGGFDIARVGEWAAIADKYAGQFGVKLPSANGVDLGALITEMAKGAAIGAPIPPPGVGAAIGAAVMVVLYSIKTFTGPRTPEVWANAGPGVREWFTAYGPQAFLDWAREQYGEALTFQTVPDAVASYLSWRLLTEGMVFVSGDGQRTYSGIYDGTVIGQLGGEQVAREFYRQYGVDYDATKLIRNQAGNTSPHLVAQFKAVVNVPGVYAGEPLTVGDYTPDGQTGGANNNTALLLGLGVAAAAYVATSK